MALRRRNSRFFCGDSVDSIPPNLMSMCLQIELDAVEHYKKAWWTMHFNPNMTISKHFHSPFVTKIQRFQTGHLWVPGPAGSRSARGKVLYRHFRSWGRAIGTTNLIWLVVWNMAFIFPYGYGSIPINTIFSGMNIHLPAILMFTRGTRFWHTATWLLFFHILRLRIVTPSDSYFSEG